MQLYKESQYWNLNELRRAIEEDKLHLRSTTSETGDKNTNEKEWWRTLPSYYQAVHTPPEAPKNEPEDWWKSNTYKGRVYGPLSTDPEKIVTTEKDKDIKPTLQTTWNIPPPSSSYTMESYEDLRFDEKNELHIPKREGWSYWPPPSKYIDHIGVKTKEEKKTLFFYK